jgi:hypothetical protein
VKLPDACFKASARSSSAIKSTNSAPPCAGNNVVIVISLNQLQTGGSTVTEMPPLSFNGPPRALLEPVRKTVSRFPVKMQLG